MVFACFADSAFSQAGGLGNFGTLGGVEPNSTTYPPQEYFVALRIYRSGDLENATDAFENALHRTRKDINGRWIDAIPVYAMLGECYWHLGMLPKVRENVDAAMQIAIRYRGWQNRVDWDSAVRQGVQLSPTRGLWPEAAAIKRIPVADRLQIGSGQHLTEQALAQGGVIEEFNIRSMDIVEIIRGLAIASYRKRVLMGPLANQDPLSSELAEAIDTAGLSQPIAQSMLGCVRASARFSNGDDRRAVQETLKTTTFAGGVHPISAIGLLLQAAAIAESDKGEGMLAASMATAHAAAALEQSEWVGEAFQLAAGAATPKEALAVRAKAELAANAMLPDSRLAALHCFVAAADAAVSAGDLDSATRLVAQARALSERRDVLMPRVQAYGSYVAARLAAARGDAFGIGLGSGNQSVVDQTYQSMQSFAFNNRINNRRFVSMPSLYQLNLVGQAIGSRAGGATSDELLAYYCGEPPLPLWRRDPVDALTFATFDRSVPLAGRLALSTSGSDGGSVLRRCDELLADRFAQSLPMSGRVAQVRRLARADDAQLPADALQFRANGPGAIKELRQSVLDLRKQAAAGLDNDTILQAGSEQEAMASFIALSRLSLPRLVPQRIDRDAPVENLPPRTVLVTFVYSNKRLYTTTAADGNIQSAVSPIGRTPAAIAGLLRSIGVGKTRGGRLPEDDSWRKDAAALMKTLLPDTELFKSGSFDRLVIVPDGPLWYLPFELLPIDGEESETLGQKYSITYAATPGQVLEPATAAETNQTIGLIASRFFDPRDLENNQSIADSIVAAADKSIMMPTDTPTASLVIGNEIGNLLVAVPTAMDPSDPFKFRMIPYDQSKVGATLGGWMRFPSIVPHSVALAGFRSQAEAAKLGDGRELFMTICALRTAGVQNILVSRWAVGGESTAILLREFAQELPFTGMRSAWNRANGVLRRSDLVPSAEPLLISGDQKREVLTGEEPLFWAGYLLASPVQAE
ncbi:CHAT domain protein [Novipirellula aureliae]|uniref:CHAT domain protein n=2 Tax=Novipirellula aureliae TaxID=2527966 RepID=A0A5C6E4H9_9BACT|nr:CHAT domain protein [Novipirellula aureliae]